MREVYQASGVRVLFLPPEFENTHRKRAKIEHFVVAIVEKTDPEIVPKKLKLYAQFIVHQRCLGKAANVFQNFGEILAVKMASFFKHFRMSLREFFLVSFEV